MPISPQIKLIQRIGFVCFMLLTLIAAPALAQTPPSSPDILNTSLPTDIWALILTPGTDPNAVATQFGYEYLGQIADIPNTYLFRIPSTDTSAQSANAVTNTLRGSPQIVRVVQQIARQQFPRTPSDPLFPNQWHLNNTIPGFTGQDANVVPAWNAGFTGASVQIAVVDDGLQRTHPDLATNYLATTSYDYNGNSYFGYDPDPDPAPGPYDAHGTSAAGVAAARDNTTCGVGAAYRANLSGIRLISAPVTDAEEANALSYKNGASGNTALTNDIYSNSWGPYDDAKRVEGPGELTLNAFFINTNQGRGGRGSIYAWAAGNGREYGDNINADGYANSRFVIAVGASGRDGNVSYYSESGAPMLVNAPSNDDSIGITTTDILGGGGYDAGNCTSEFGGTSSAAPLVAGIVALMLEANPDLTWRDVQYILAQTAEKNDPTDPGWANNAAGYHVNHDYGFGRIDAAAAVTASQNWDNVGPEMALIQPTRTPNLTVPNNNATGVSDSVTVSGANYPVEHVELVFTATGPYRGDFGVILTSPSGTQSQLMTPRFNDTFSGGWGEWRFSSVRNWGENSNGTWTVKVYDGFSRSAGNSTFGNWQLIIYTQSPPPTPTLSSPANGQTFSTPTYFHNTTLSWASTAPYNNAGYELRIHPTDPNLAAPIIVHSTSYTLPLPLGGYVWNVKALGRPEVGNSAFSTNGQFSVVTTADASPVRNFFTTGTPTLTWGSITTANTYHLQIATSNTFATVTIIREYETPDAGTLEWQVTPALDDGTYYFRVAARTAQGLRPYSSIDSFIVDVP